jgi:hypothetical protein
MAEGTYLVANGWYTDLCDNYERAVVLSDRLILLVAL